MGKHTQHALLTLSVLPGLGGPSWRRWWEGKKKETWQRRVGSPSPACLPGILAWVVKRRKRQSQASALITWESCSSCSSATTITRYCNPTGKGGLQLSQSSSCWLVESKKWIRELVVGGWWDRWFSKQMWGVEHILSVCHSPHPLLMGERPLCRANVDFHLHDAVHDLCRSPTALTKDIVWIGPNCQLQTFPCTGLRLGIVKLTHFTALYRIIMIPERMYVKCSADSKCPMCFFYFSSAKINESCYTHFVKMTSLPFLELE